MLRRGVLLALSAVLLIPTVAARAANRGLRTRAPRPFVVPLSSPALYGINPTTDKHYLTAPDGTKLFVETWLPAAKNGNVPPAKIPTILVITPYVQEGTLESQSTRDAMVTRGYAYSQLHVRGTGMSTGCIQMYSQTEANDGAQAIEWVAGKGAHGSSWGNGVVGGYGVSYPGGTILNAAARGNPAKTQYLKAVLAGAPAVSLYESAWTFDGVESMLIPQLYYGQYMTTTSLPPGTENGQPAQYVEQYSQKPQCYPEHIAAGMDHSGDFTPYFQDRELRGSVGNIKAAVFTFHGHADNVPYHGVPPIVQIGLFDRLPATTPKFGIFGEFGHESPSSNARGPAVYQRRADFLNMEIAWFDHYLKGIDGGVSTWGTAQVQGTDSKWRVVPDWPRDTGGPTATLPLAAGVLGAKPNQLGGSTTYLEAGFETTQGSVPGTTATFDTGRLKQPLELTGAAQLNLWLKLTLPDSHVAARLDAFDASGKPIVTGSTYALRSAQHRDPFTDGRFMQAHGSPAPTGTPFELTLRFQPTDIVIPAGGRLRLTIAGSLIVNQGLSQIDDQPVTIPEPLFHGPSEPSGVVQPVEILTDKQHESALIFQTPPKNPDYIAPALVPR
ncbi:MAG: CocE/NonD family hydrolase [Actinobacteria bacterium]|nr:CocE/NonD family hydrolase [Actinomycetota bacterium]